MRWRNTEIGSRVLPSAQHPFARGNSPFAERSRGCSLADRNAFSEPRRYSLHRREDLSPYWAPSLETSPGEADRRFAGFSAPKLRSAATGTRSAIVTPARNVLNHGARWARNEHSRRWAGVTEPSVGRTTRVHLVWSVVVGLQRGLRGRSNLPRFRGTGPKEQV